jgi:RNA polymerase sigma-70 factor (ECF subfamily)
VWWRCTATLGSTSCSGSPTHLWCALAIAFGDEELAADVVQDAFVQALRRWRRVEAYDRPEAWVRRVAVNRAIDHRRRGARHEGVLRRLNAPADEADADRATSLDIEHAIAALPLKQRLAVSLHYVADLPVAEVADVLSVSEGTIKSNLSDARRSLAPLLEVPDA